MLLFDFGLGALNNATSKDLIKTLKNYQFLIAADSQSSSLKGNLMKFKGANLLAPTESELRDCLADHHSGLKVSWRAATRR